MIFGGERRRSTIPLRMEKVSRKFFHNFELGKGLKGILRSILTRNFLIEIFFDQIHIQNDMYCPYCLVPDPQFFLNRENTYEREREITTQ